MTEIVSPVDWRAWDANGNPVPGAQAYSYIEGTDTLLTLYSESGDPLPNPLVADGAARFTPLPRNTSSNNVRMVVKHPTTLVILAQWEVAPTASTTPQNASGVSFSATANIPLTNVQAAVERVDTNWRSAKTGNATKIVTGAPGVSGHIAKWDASGNLQTAGFSVPTPVAGDLLQGTSTTAHGVLSKGTAGQYLRVNSGATGHEYVNENALGVGQTWQDVSASRSAGTSYQNTTGRPIQAIVAGENATTNQFLQVSSDGSTWLDLGNVGANGRYLTSTITIPDDWYYRIFTGATVAEWHELR